MDDTLVRAEPPQLAVRLQLPVDAAEVAAELVDVTTDQRLGTLPGRRDAQNG